MTPPSQPSPQPAPHFDEEDTLDEPIPYQLTEWAHLARGPAQLAEGEE